jgi:hypothetical protein
LELVLAVQVRLTVVTLTAVATRLLGAAGAAPAGVVTVAVLEAGELLPAASRATTVKL